MLLNTYQFVGRNSGAERSVLRRDAAAPHTTHYASLRCANALYGLLLAAYQDKLAASMLGKAERKDYLAELRRGCKDILIWRIEANREQIALTVQEKVICFLFSLLVVADKPYVVYLSLLE